MAIDIPQDAQTWSWPIQVEHAAVPYTQLVVREPTGAEWALWDKLNGLEAQFMALSVVSGIPEPAIRQIGARTLTEAGKFLERFFA